MPRKRRVSYPGHYEVRKVAGDKTIKWHDRKVFVSNLLRFDYVGLDAGKTFLFHETVVLALNALSVTQAQIARFGELLEGLDVVSHAKKIEQISWAEYRAQ